MAKIEILIPTMGESIFECTVLKWLIKEGDRVEIDDLILEVATDKIDTEIGSSHAGVVTKFLVEEGQTAIIGKPIFEISTENEIKKIIDQIASSGTSLKKIEKSIEMAKISLEKTNSNGIRFYSPLVLNIAKKENISPNELEKISGTGLENRVTKDNILEYISNKNNNPETGLPATTISNNDQVIEMDRMRKMIAQRMVESKKIAPHVTSFIETDMTELVNWRSRVKDNFKVKHNENLTFTPLLIEAVIKAIKDFPGINIQVDKESIIYKKDINIGMAVALPNGNLIVPVIHKADQYTLSELAIKVNDLAKRARNNQLRPEELIGGSYTVTNIGSFGNLSGTPIILQPQVAIMAFGVIRKMPSVIETEEGDFIGIRQKMVISHSYDHRVVDGSLGGLFLKKVSDYLEKFNAQRDL